MTDKTVTTTHFDNYVAAAYRMEGHARRCLAEAIADVRASIRDAFEPGGDPHWLAHECIDGSEWVIYTARAEAVVRGYGEEEAREMYRRDFGADHTPSIEALAYAVLYEAVADLVGDLDEM
jgi:hypothetical protein